MSVRADRSTFLFARDGKMDIMSGAAAGFDLRVTDDRMSVLLDCTVQNGNMEPLLTSVKTELMRLKIHGAPSRKQLKEQVRDAAEEKGSRLEGFVLLEGTRPVPPENGTIEWARDFFSVEFALDEKTGTVDYRRRVVDLTVKEGELLARVIRPRPGQDGQDVFGKPIRVDKGKPASIRKGPNVRVEEQDGVTCYYATANGRFHWALNTLAVDKVYTVRGSVGLATGHINHPGALEIAKDVEEGSEIEAGGDIEIGGVVEPSNIVAGGNLVVRCGITGDEGKIVKVKGSIHSKFILGANIEAGGDIVVEKEIVNSNLKTQGVVKIPSGRLVGGETTALGGIEVGRAGSDALSRTVLVAGVDYVLERELPGKKQQVVMLEKQAKKIHKLVDPMMANQKSLTAKQRETATELLAKAAEMEMSIDERNTEIERLKDDARERATMRILIKDKVYPETMLRIGEAEMHVKQESSGPLQAVVAHADLVLKPA